MKLNIACGSAKIEGYVNIDGEESVKPDLVCDIRKGLPYENESIEEILFFHAIEHIEENQHEALLCEFHRVLRTEGILYISYPEFTKIAQNYINNFRGQREFWKNTIYGLQRYPGDYHVALMDSQYFVEVLQGVGFENIQYQPEEKETYNTIVRCVKGAIPKDYTDLLNSEVACSSPLSLLHS